MGRIPKKVSQTMYDYNDTGVLLLLNITAPGPNRNNGSCYCVLDIGVFRLKMRVVNFFATFAQLLLEQSPIVVKI